MLCPVSQTSSHILNIQKAPKRPKKTKTLPWFAAQHFAKNHPTPKNNPPFPWFDSDETLPACPARREARHIKARDKEIEERWLARVELCNQTSSAS
jgi:hypothetical protein